MLTKTNSQISEDWRDVLELVLDRMLALNAEIRRGEGKLTKEDRLYMEGRRRAYGEIWNKLRGGPPMTFDAAEKRDYWGDTSAL